MKIDIFFLPERMWTDAVVASPVQFAGTESSGEF